MKPTNATPIPWPPFGVAPILANDGTFEPNVIMVKDAGEENELLGAWPLASVTSTIVIQALRWQKLNLKTHPPSVSVAAVDDVRQIRDLLFREGEALAEVGTTRHVNEQIALGLWTIDQIYRQTAALKKMFPNICGHWPVRADLWRSINNTWAGSTTPWVRNEKKRAERIARFDDRLRPEAKPGLVASALKASIEALKTH